MLDFYSREGALFKVSEHFCTNGIADCAGDIVGERVIADCAGEPATGWDPAQYPAGIPILGWASEFDGFSASEFSPCFRLATPHPHGSVCNCKLHKVLLQPQKSRHHDLIPLDTSRLEIV